MSEEIAYERDVEGMDRGSVIGRVNGTDLFRPRENLVVTLLKET